MTDSNYWPGGQNRGNCSRGVWEKKRFGVRGSSLKDLKLLAFGGFAARLKVVPCRRIGLRGVPRAKETQEAGLKARRY